METVKAERGYHGPVVVCAVYFTPVAGYIPDRPVIKYLAAQRNIEIAFAPIAGTRILVPFRMVIPTPLGPAHAGSHQLRDQGHAAARGEDAVGRYFVIPGWCEAPDPELRFRVRCCASPRNDGEANPH